MSNYFNQRINELLSFAQVDVCGAAMLATNTPFFAPFFERLTTEQRQQINSALK